MTSPEEDEVVRHPLAAAIDRATFLPAPLYVISNALTWGASRVFRHHFNVGANEWRVLSALSLRVGITASEACKIRGIKKAIASMSIKSLREKGLIVIEDKAGSKLIYLTRKGAEIHDAIVPIARARESILLAGLNTQEIKQLFELVAAVEKQLPQLQAYDDAMAAGTPGEDSPDEAE